MAMKAALANFTWPKPADTSEQKICADVINHRCHIITIPKDSEGPTYSFSIGLYLNFQHPEVVIFGLSQHVAGVTINDICSRVEKGGNFQAEQESDEFFTEGKVKFVVVDPKNYRDFLGSAQWFYRCLNGNFPVLQAVWTDKLGKFPWEEGHDQMAAKFQPLLNNAHH